MRRTVDQTTIKARVRERYADAARSRQDRIMRSIRGAGADYLHLSTDRDWVLDLAQFVSRRSLRG